MVDLNKLKGKIVSDTEQEIELEIQERRLNAPRITPEHIDSRIRYKTFTILPNGRTTVCQLTLINGFTVEGYSSCVSIENFNKEIGEKIAYQNARNEIWGYEGYLLAEHLYRGEIG